MGGRGIAIRVGTLAIMVMLLGACTAAPAPSAKPQEKAAPAPAPADADVPVDSTEFSVAYLTGMLDVPVRAIQQNNLVDKYQVNVEFRQFGDVTTINDAFVLKQVTVQPGANFQITSRLKIERDYGLAIFPTFAATNKIVVPTDSPIQSIADLQGKRIAIGSTTGAEITVLSWILGSEHGIDLFRDADPRSVPPPVQLQLLQQGEVDAALLFEPWAARAQFGGNGRVIWDIQEEWQQRKNQPLWFSAIHVDDEFARDHPNALRRYLMAYSEAVDIINSDLEGFLQYYKEAFEITDDRDFEILVNAHRGVFSNRWNDDVIASMKEYIQLEVDNGSIPRIPDELFTKDYAPPASLN